MHVAGNKNIGLPDQSFSRKHEDLQPNLNELHAELRDLRSKLKMQEEIAGFEKEHNESLKKKLANMEEMERKQIQNFKLEVEKFQEELAQKMETIKM